MKLRKLTLRRETLRELNARDLAAVAGGLPAPATLRTCPVTDPCICCTLTEPSFCVDLTKPTMPC